MAFFDDLKAASFAGSGGSPAPQPTLITKSVTANGTYRAADDEADGYSTVSVSVPNSYSAGDEGKVVSNGALVAQGSDEVTTNGTVDTTLISSLLVNVSGGSSDVLLQCAKLTSTSTSVYSKDLYICETNSGVYVFGSLSRTSGTDSVDFSIPKTFDTSMISTYKFGCKKTDAQSFNLASITMTFTASSLGNRISFPVTSGNGVYVGKFSKST